MGLQRHYPPMRIDADAGIVYGHRGRPIGSLSPDGYVVIPRRSSGQPDIRAHRLIWSSVNGPIPSGMEINHKNGIKTDNRIANLELVTRQGNVLHAYRIGLKSNAGEKHPSHLLTADQVRAIRARYVRYSRHANAAVLAVEFGVGRKCIADVVIGRSWTSVA